MLHPFAYEQPSVTPRTMWREDCVDSCGFDGHISLWTPSIISCVSCSTCLMMMMMTTRHSGQVQQQKSESSDFSHNWSKQKPQADPERINVQTNCFHSVKESLLPNVRVRYLIKGNTRPRKLPRRVKTGSLKHHDNLRRQYSNILTLLPFLRQNSGTSPLHNSTKCELSAQSYDTDCAVSQKPCSAGDNL